MQREPWIHFWGNGSRAARQPLLDALAEAGTRPRGLDADDAAGDGIVCFTIVNDDLCDFLREVSRERRQRVLAVPLAGAAMCNQSIWRLLRTGVSDVLSSSSTCFPSDLVGRIKARLERWHAVDALMQSEVVTDKLIGASPAWRTVLRQIVEVSRFTRAPVLLLGESGTGKELLGRVIHDVDPIAARKDLIVADCTTVVPDLSGSEFFGHERGAFTGAVATRDGAFASADGGTLFLDEVGDLPMPLQAQLLRVIQEGMYKRVGSDTWRRSAFRLVCATHRNLMASLRDGRFRQDLYYRIAGWVFRVPSLSERTEDIIPLAEHFLREFQPTLEPFAFDAPLTEHLANRAYPGNVRELRQLIARVASRHVGPGPITVGDLPEDERPPDEPERDAWRGSDFQHAIERAVSQGVGLREISHAAADTAMRIALRRGNGNLQAAARALLVTDRALQMRRAAWRNSLRPVELDPPGAVAFDQQQAGS
jgi:transcriptional regulator with GAF, ATPase, and Fis domain